MKILTVIGARPQFIKASVVSRELAAQGIIEEIVHTGQHFDTNMSDIFFNQLKIPKPAHHLGIGGGTHGQNTGRMIESIEQVLLNRKPDRILVYGDTDSTLAGALAAIKLHIPVAHVEAGLRSFNIAMPEEINRMLTDQISDILFCPTETAVNNLKQEGFKKKQVRILRVGDVMQDAALFFAKHASPPGEIIKLDEMKSGFILATLHRAENTDNTARLKAIVDALNNIHNEILPIVLPLHPRTRAALIRDRIFLDVSTIDPVGYLQMLALLQRCTLVLTDSGGLQKEAFFFNKPCVTMRDETEWVELIACGANRLAGAEAKKIIDAARQMLRVNVSDPNNLYGGGTAAQAIVRAMQ